MELLVGFGLLVTAGVFVVWGFQTIMKWRLLRSWRFFFAGLGFIAYAILLTLMAIALFARIHW